MVSRRQMAEIAMRYTTTMSAAMLRALGVGRMAAGRQYMGPHDRGAYKGVLQCFRNEGSPMDGLR